ncbi:helix-turn-helix transcriptional regulator [Qingshengfaniella alkalisoli]|uniref:helix-turn-helix transcriptional regulator n=1 Tax=Qingshengfaniella alkalisoli TaxID=2599296 RepID=UPI00143D76E4|nr:LuxR C-terminal-related transcriptional regulator [Qingshengfaniella alkalisoli]
MSNRRHFETEFPGQSFEVLIVGSAIFYSARTFKQIESEFYVHCMRADDLRSVLSAKETLPQSLQLIVVDQNFTEELLELGNDLTDTVGSAVIALAYRDGAKAREFLDRWQSQTSRSIGFLPMRISVEVWLSMLRLLLHSQYVFPEDLQPCPAKLANQINTRPAIPPVSSDEHIRRLTIREREVLELIVLGESNKRIASELAITEHTVKLHVHNLVKKMGVPNRTAAVGMYYQAAKQGSLV